VLELFDVQMFNLKQRIGRSIEGVGVIEQLTIAFQSQCSASLDLRRSRAFFHDRDLNLQGFRFIGVAPQGNRTCRASPDVSGEGLCL
jgi:hypothetical protein